MCVPGDTDGMVMLAVEGEPATTGEVPMLVPSSVNVTVPDGCVEPVVVEVIVAETSSELPGAGVVVAGLTTSVVGALATISVTVSAVELPKLASPLYEAPSV